MSPVEKARLADSEACNIEAYEYFLRGREFLLGEIKTREKFEQSKDFFMRALEFDPNHSEAYAGLSWAYMFDYFNRWSDKPDTRCSSPNTPLNRRSKGSERAICTP